MVQRIIKKAKIVANILFADPKLLYKKDRHLVNQPFFFEGNNGKGVLLIHGWTSTPYEVRRLGKYLNENGYTVLGVQLSGHGTVPKDLENVKWGQWVSDVEKGIEKLKKICDKVYLGGTSIGSNIALVVAKKRTDIAGLILMATPYKLRLEPVVLFFAKMLLKFKKQYRKKFYPPTFGLATTITRLISYQTYPIKSVLESFKIVEFARTDLQKVSQPCLLMQSTHDHIVAKNSMEEIYRKIGSQVKRKKYVEKAYHTFISDIKNEYIFNDILNFLDEN